MIFCMVSCDEAKDLLQVSSNIPMPLSTGSCADAKYLKEARAWDVTTLDVKFENVGRIELTSSGNYMLLPRVDNLQFEDGTFEEPTYSVAGSDVRSVAGSGKVKSSPFRKVERSATRAYGSYPAGTFTKISDNEYELSDLGRLIVGSDGKLTLIDGTGEHEFEATPVVNSYTLDDLTRRFSRTWELAQVERAYYDYDGKLVKKRYMSQADIEDDFVRAVVVTQYGTFVRYEWDGELAGCGIWRWEIPEKQFFQYVFNDGGFYGSFSLEQVFFYDDYAMFLEYNEEYDSETGEYYDTVDVLKAKSVDSLDL